MRRLAEVGFLYTSVLSISMPCQFSSKHGLSTILTPHLWSFLSHFCGVLWHCGTDPLTILLAWVFAQPENACPSVNWPSLHSESPVVAWDSQNRPKSAQCCLLVTCICLSPDLSLELTPLSSTPVSAICINAPVRYPWVLRSTFFIVVINFFIY